MIGRSIGSLGTWGIIRPHAILLLLVASILMAGMPGGSGGADSAPPQTTALLSGGGGANGWNTTSVNVTLQAADEEGGSGVNYTRFNLGGAGWQNYTEEIVVSGDGAHLLQYYSVDNANNTEGTKNVTVRIDGAPPSLSLGQTNGSVVGSGNFKVTWICSDAASGIDYFEVLSDGALFDQLNSSAREDRVTNLEDGWHEVAVRAYDKAGNFAERTVSFRVWANQGDQWASAEVVIAAAALASAAVLALYLVRRRRGKSPPERKPGQE